MTAFPNETLRHRTTLAASPLFFLLLQLIISLVSLAFVFSSLHDGCYPFHFLGSFASKYRLFSSHPGSIHLSPDGLSMVPGGK